MLYWVSTYVDTFRRYIQHACRWSHLQLTKLSSSAYSRIRRSGKHIWSSRLKLPEDKRITFLSLCFWLHLGLHSFDSLFILASLSDNTDSLLAEFRWMGRPCSTWTLVDHINRQKRSYNTKLTLINKGRYASSKVLARWSHENVLPIC